MYSDELSRKLNTWKLCRCGRCLYEDKVKWKDRTQKVCPKCLQSESILEKMHLVPARHIDHEAVATVAEDYKDWEDDGYEQEELQTG